VCRSLATRLIVLALASAGCRSVAPEGPLPESWRTLVAPPYSFAGLYRLTCCGHSDMVMAVRADGTRVGLTVMLPPAITVLNAWVEGNQGWLVARGGRCRTQLARGTLPIGESTTLPLDGTLAAMLLLGLLPPGASAIPAAQGWVQAVSDDWWLRARVEGPQPHLVRALIGRPGDDAPRLVADFERMRGSVPASIVIRAGATTASLTLESLGAVAAPAAPAWLSWPACGSAP
jgi:hypothetical protein